MQSLSRFSFLPLLNLQKPISSYHLKQIHAQLITNGLKEPSFFAKLIENYCLLSSPQNTKYARLIFEHFHTQSLFLFNTLLRCSQPNDSIFTFAYWVSKGLLVFDDFTYNFVLGACARSQSLSTLWLGRQVHVKAFKSGLMSNLLVKTTLIHFYAINKDILLARSVFDEMTERSSATWNAMIKGYTSQRGRSKKCCREALVLFRDMLNDVSGQIPTDTTMVCVLSACSQLGEIYSGACVHGFIEKTIWVPESDVFIGTGLVDMYAKCGYIDSALSIFRLMSVKNVLTWTAMGTGLAVHGRGKEALELLDAMEGSEIPIKPDAVLWRSLLRACTIHGDLAMAEKVGKILLRLEPPKNSLHMPITSEDYIALSNVYASTGRWRQVEMVRNKMKLKRVETKPGGSYIRTVCSSP
ncbi:hypothetical protein ES319_A11G244400v1 [Gossypium barbadense]|uniref:Pentacotripeptide-repeat region of PRORP domain-containing protein n=1 Tax=Gossypium barbadense TaxID=3634 RepID=A0A5J5TS36_GOSBA|nr:hypothetical protein ES319_A11G244400v1 [Gossypium barbadense]